ncbi:MAG: hypothetical protein U0529_08150 [Thermoanaerobaculia bacterium]
MNHASLVRDAAARSGLPEPDVERVVAALADLVHDGHVSPDELLHALLGAADPLHEHPADPRDPALVADLVERAKTHPLGIDYLKGGHLGSVAATFETHAFTVLAARDLLR